MSTGAVAVRDGIGRHVSLQRAPQRIVSLVPSTTETLAELGAGERVVGRTRYCVHPRPWVDGLPVIGGTKDPDPDAIAALRPDLIVANEEENKPELWPALSAIAPLYVAYPRTVDEALVDLATLGRLVGVEDAAARRVAEIEQQRRGRTHTFSFVYLVWRRPWMAAGGDTFVSDLLSELGGVNVLQAAARYPSVSAEELVAADPDVVLLATEPFPFRPEHVVELPPPLADRCRIIDGELASWHGARMSRALPELRRFFDAG